VAKEKKEKIKKETFAVKQNTSGHYVGGGIKRKCELITTTHPKDTPRYRPTAYLNDNRFRYTYTSIVV